MIETRRCFLASAAGMAATAGLSSASAEAALPAIRLGKYEVSRMRQRTPG